MISASPRFRTRLARTAADLRATQRLRYRVFVTELGASGPMVDHDAKIEADRFDAHADHLLLEDLARPSAPVVGVYRVMTADQARAAGGFSTEAEFDIAPLLTSGRRLLELGRSCLAPAYRGGPAMMHLFEALAQHVARTQSEVIFGLASFHGTDPERLRQPLRYLHQHHLAPAALRPHATGPGAVPPDTTSVTDRKAALRQVPALIKAYLRLGATLGAGACVDAAFNTTDVCIVLDTATMSPAQRARFGQGQGA